jgi:hypothetical protein
MTFSPGLYETRGGFVVRIIKLESLNKNNWLFTGVLQVENVYYLGYWRIDGRSTAEERFDLVREVICAEKE